jgi:NAD(P)-dependent dehydrogenase (short-subunit alcohol dehydrogenase family)
MSSKPLKGLSAVVTGGAKGIGLAIARRLAAEGADLIILGRDAAALDAAADTLGCSQIVADVTDPVELERSFALIGHFDILVNNAGAALSKPFGKTGPEDWHAMLALNLTAAYHTTRLALPGMLARRWGRIVNIASTAGVKGYAYTTAYCAAKHGLVGLTRSLALETAKTGVTVNAVCPGFTDTDLVTRAVEVIQAKTGRTAEAAKADLAHFNPQDRLVQPTEVAEAVAFLCRREAAAMTGQSLIVAGGEVM